MTGSLCPTSQGATSPTGTVPFYLDWKLVSMRVCALGLYPCSYSHSTRAHFTGPWLCILKTLTSWANMPLWRHGGILSVEIESEIKKKKKKNLLHRKEKRTPFTVLTDIRACSFSHGEVINLALSLFKNILFWYKKQTCDRFKLW